MPSFIRRAYHALLPESLREALRPLAYPGSTIFRALAWRAAGGRVFAGPFAGLRLAPKPYLPHLVGSYELELHATINSLCKRPWRKIVNVGGGNGFYIAGLGRLVPGAELIVFELTAEARAVIAATMERNGLTSRTRILGAADPSGLEDACVGDPPTLVVMDVEGAEVELTDPSLVPSLRGATILVETHDFARPGCSALVAERLADTHSVTKISTRVRTLADFPPTLAPWLRRVAPGRCLEAVQEWRPEAQQWLLLEPRAR